MSSAAGCLSPPGSSTTGCRQRAVADGHGAPTPPPAIAPASRTSSPLARAHAVADGAGSSPHPHSNPPHPRARAIILHPRHAYRLPRPLPVVRPVVPQAAAAAPPTPPTSLAAALDVDALSCVAARLGDGWSLAAFAATSRACKLAAYDERLWRRECERRFGPVAPLPPPPSTFSSTSSPSSSSSSSSSSPPSWRRLYAFNAAAYDAVVAAAREAERARAIGRLLGGAAAQRWAAGRAAFAH